MAATADSWAGVARLGSFAVAMIVVLGMPAEAQRGPASRAQSCGNCPPNYCENLGDIARLIEQKKQAARAEGVPDRLLALYDKLAPCRACIERASVVPRLVVIYDPQKYRAKFGSAISVADTSWNRQDEKSARDAMRDGVAKEIHFIIGDSACECCKRNFTAAQLDDWKKRTNFPPDREPGRPPRGIGIHLTSVDQLGAYPADLSELPPDTSKRPPVDPGPMDTQVMPKSRIIHVVCQTCQPLADQYNDVVRDINAAIDEYAEAKRAAIKAQRLLQQAHDEETDAGKLAETVETRAVRARIASTVAQRARDYDQASTKAQQLADKVKALQAKLPPIRSQIAACEKQCLEARKSGPAAATSRTDVVKSEAGRGGKPENSGRSGAKTAAGPQDDLSLFHINRRGELELERPKNGANGSGPQDDLHLFDIDRRGRLVMVGGGVAQRNNMRQTSAGAFFNGIAEQPILRSRDHVTTTGGEFNLFVPRSDFAGTTSPGENRGGGGAGGIQFLARYSQGKTSDSGAIAPGGPNTGFQFIDDFQGSGGVTGVPGGQSVQLDVEMTIMDAMLLYWQEVARSGSTSIRAGVGAEVSRRNVKTSIAQQNPTFPGINSTTSTEVTDTFVALRTAAQIVHQIAGTGLYVSVIGSLAAGYLHSSGSADQQFNCALCAPPFNSVALSRSFSQNGASVGATLGAMAGYSINQRADIFVGFFNDWAYQSHVDVPATNTDPRATFTGNFLYSGRAKVGARVSLP